ncbi:MAG: hypothetical protein Kapaf2KO_06050 [Candidatus Kapaibacteriales bacterium]
MGGTSFSLKALRLSPIILLAVLFGFQIVKVTRHHYKAQIDIYDQHVNLSKMILNYSNAFLEPLIINDIGAITYFTDKEIVDIWGLATYDIAVYKGDMPELEWLEYRESSSAKVAIIYDSFFAKKLDSWIKVAEWKSKETWVAGSDIIGFYAKDTNSAIALKSALIKYNKESHQNILLTLLK